MQINNEILNQIWEDRYQKNGESIDENISRVAKYCSTNAEEEKEFYNVMNEGLFLPAGRTMSNAGVGKDLTLNNCFTLNFVEDSIDDIFEKVKMAAKTHQRGGGTGFEFSKIRPNGTPTSNEAIASGVVSFLNVFDSQTATINQGSRRGANMGVLSIYHPDVFEYINAKSYEEGKLTHFNLSVMVDDDFMIAVKEDKEIYLHYPIYDECGSMIKDESLWQVKKQIKAKELWDMVMRKAYDNGEPGVLFYENMNRDNNVWYMENIVNSNPCGEYISGTLFEEELKKFLKKKAVDTSKFKGACNLGSLFIQNFVENPFTPNAFINYDKIKEATRSGVKLLDNIVDINKFPLKDYENYQKNLRTIGLGITGLADAMTMLGIKYGSDASIKFTDDLMNFISKSTYESSIELAKERGSFPFLDAERFVQSGFIQKHIKKDIEWQQIADDILQYGIRNARLLSVAPVGTMSLTFGNNCSSGCEPIFSLEYDRKVKIGGQDESNVRIVKMEDYAYRLWKETKSNNIVGKDVFVTAQELTVKEHLDILKTVAFHVDMSVSKTINIPTEYSFEDTKKVYNYAWENGIKGCTIFRPNPIRQGILLTNTDKIEEEKEETHNDLSRGVIYEVDEDLIGRKAKLMTGCGSLHLQAWFDPFTGDMMEVFLAKGSDGGCNSYMIGLSRMISLALRGGIHIESVVDQLKSTPSCPSYTVRTVTKRDTSRGNCCPTAISNILINLQKEVKEELGIDEYEEVKIIKPTVKQKDKKENVSTSFTKEELEYKTKYGETPFAMRYSKCPSCGEHIEHTEGCLSCVSCGWTKC